MAVSRKYIEDPLLTQPFGTKSKPFERRRDLMNLELFPKGKKGDTTQVPLKAALLLLFVLARDSREQDIIYAVADYVKLENQETGESFYDAFPRVIKNLSNVSSIEISRTFPFAIIHYSDETKDEVFSYYGFYEDAEFEYHVTSTYRLPKSYLRKFYHLCIQTTDRGYKIPDSSDLDREIDKMISMDREAAKEIFRNWPSKRDIEKAIS